MERATWCCRGLPRRLAGRSCRYGTVQRRV